MLKAILVEGVQQWAIFNVISGKRSREAGIYHIRQDPRCRLCKDAPETIHHITAGYKIVAGREYMERSNQVAGVYRNISAEYDLEVSRSR